MKPDTREALVQTFRVAERFGKRRPSNAMVFAFVRGMGHAFTGSDGKALLAKFRESSVQSRSTIGPTSVLDLSTNGPEPTLDRSTTGPATRARPKVLLVPKKELSLSSSTAGDRQRVRPETPEAVRFPDGLEGEVHAFLAVVAAENKSGEITAGRSLALRRELHDLLNTVGDDALTYGLRAAIRAGAGSVNYVAKAARGNATRGVAVDAWTAADYDLNREIGLPEEPAT